MSTTPPAERNFLTRWKDFWFAPGDPTTLGFIRIATGLLVLYTHLAYSVDLQAFFGRYGWYGSSYMERERKESPNYLTTFRNWDETKDVWAVAPEPPLRHAAVIQFIRNLPASESERKAALHYLTLVTEEENPYAARLAINLVRRLYSVGETQRERMLVGGLEPGRQWYELNRGAVEYRDEKPEDGRAEPIFPDLLLPPLASQEKRTAIAADLRALFRVLPKDSMDAQYVLAHLDELDQSRRKAFVQFMVALPSDPVERTKVIDYFDFWNSDPSKANSHGIHIFSVWFHVTNPDSMAAIHFLILIIIALFTIGLFTRVTSVLTWLAVLSYIHRTNQVLFGMDTMMNILLIYLMIGNSGAALSVDRLIARYRAAKASIRRCGTIDAPAQAFLVQAPFSVGANFGVRLIQVHFCFIYLAAGLSKLAGAGWWSGTAFWDVMINPEFTLMKYEWFEKSLRWLVGNDEFGKPFYYAATMLGVWFTWGLEICFPFLVWTKARAFMLWMAVLLHAGIGVLMGLNLFELLMMTMLLVYLPPGVIRDRLRGSGQPKLNYGFNASDPRQVRAAALVAAMDVDGQVTLQPGETTDQPNAKALFGSIRLLNVLSFLLWVPILGIVVGMLFVPVSRVAHRSAAKN